MVFSDIEAHEENEFVVDPGKQLTTRARAISLMLEADSAFP